MLSYNGGASQAIAHNGPSVVAGTAPMGSAYDIAIAAQPANQTCVLDNSSGTVGSADVTSTTVYCPRSVGRRAYVEVNFLVNGNIFTSAIAVATIDPNTGAMGLLSGSTVPSSTQTIASFQLVPHSSFAWALGGSPEASVYVYTVDPNTGLLTTAAGNPYAALNGNPTDPGSSCQTGGMGSTSSIAFHPGGAFGYASNGPGYLSNGNISANETVWEFKIDPTSGAPSLVPGSNVKAVCGDPGPVTIDPSGRYAYFVASVSGPPNYRLFAFMIDATTGALTAISGTPMSSPVLSPGNNGALVAVDPAGKFAYVIDGNSNSIWAFTIDPASGALTAVPGSPLVSPGPTGITIEPHGKFAYVTEPNGIEVYAINPSTGALTLTAGGFSYYGVVSPNLQIDPSGRFGYLGQTPYSYSLGYGPGGVFGYTIDSDTGALTGMSDTPFAGIESLFLID
jgi:6-phosphogluconolactonase (cycloisomerase 2 family)